MLEHYPDLHYHGAHLKVVHDAYIIFPEELRRVIEAALPKLRLRIFELAEIASALRRWPRLANVIRGLASRLESGWVL